MSLNARSTGSGRWTKLSAIHAARAHTDETGCVLEADFYKPDFDFTGVERLTHRPDEELLLRTLVQTFLDHSLCIAEEAPQGRHLVFPSQFRREGVGDTGGSRGRESGTQHIYCDGQIVIES